MTRDEGVINRQLGHMTSVVERPVWLLLVFTALGGLSAVCPGGVATTLAADQPDRDEVGDAAPRSSAHDQEVVEAKQRLQEAAAGFGTDPTAIAGYYEIHYEHDQLTGGERTENLVAIVSLALTPSWLLQLTMLYEWDVPDQSGSSIGHGWSDLVVRTGWRFYKSPDLALFVGADVVFPTASDDQLGDGKYQIGPGGAVAVPLSAWQSLIYGIVQDFVTIGGDSGRPDVTYATLQLSLNTIWSSDWWTQLDGILNVDWSQNGKTGMTADGQIGYQFNNRWQAFLQPGVGLWGTGVQNGYEWQVVCGVRWMHSSSLIE